LVATEVAIARTLSRASSPPAPKALCAVYRTALCGASSHVVNFSNVREGVAGKKEWVPADATADRPFMLRRSLQLLHTRGAELLLTQTRPRAVVLVAWNCATEGWPREQQAALGSDWERGDLRCR